MSPKSILPELYKLKQKQIQIYTILLSITSISMKCCHYVEEAEKTALYADTYSDV